MNVSGKAAASAVLYYTVESYDYALDGVAIPSLGPTVGPIGLLRVADGSVVPADCRKHLVVGMPWPDIRPRPAGGWTLPDRSKRREFELNLWTRSQRSVAQDLRRPLPPGAPPQGSESYAGNGQTSRSLHSESRGGMVFSVFSWRHVSTRRRRSEPSQRPHQVVCEVSWSAVRSPRIGSQAMRAGRRLTFSHAGF